MHRLQARQAQYQQLLAREAGVFAEIDFSGDEPRIQSVETGETPELDLVAFLSTKQGQAKQRRALETGEPVVYEAPHPPADPGQRWRIRLEPIAGAEDEGPRLVAMARRAEPESENALPTAEEAYRQVIDHLPDAVAIMDTRGCLRYLNATGAELLGVRNAEELLDTSFRNFIPSEDHAAMQKQLRKLRVGKIADFVEHRLRRVDGEEIPVETISVPITYQGRPAVLNAVRDLRPRKRIEQAVEEHRDLFFRVFHLGPAALVIIRLSDGALIEVNEQFLDLSGYQREELIGSSTLEDEHWGSRHSWVRILHELALEGAAQNVELTFHRKGGARRTVIGAGRHIGVDGEECLLASLVDITARRRAEAAERESRALFQKIFHISPSAFAISRLEDGYFVDVNDAFCRLNGYGREEIVGHTSQELDMWCNPEQRDHLVERLREEKALVDFEFEVRTKEGDVRELLGAFQHITVEGEDCILSVLTDITARKQAEEEMRKAKEHAEEIARFRTGILTNMTHEVRTPLTVILGFTSMLREGVDEGYRRFVDRIERSGRRLLLTLDTVLDLAQLEAGMLEINIRPYNVLDAVQRAFEPLEPLAQDKGLTVDIESEEKYVYAEADRELLTRVLNHLLDNAIKFTKEGGVTVAVHSGKEQVRIEVRDTGIGIDEEFMPRLFDPFSQESTGLDRTYQGSGLGLSVSKQLIERMNGTLEVESRKGKGSVFTVVLPKAEEEWAV